MEILNDIKEQLTKFSTEREKAIAENNLEQAARIRDREIMFRNAISEALFPIDKGWELKDFLAMAWGRITAEFHLGNICSERHLQSELFYILKSNNQFSEQYKIYVEPTLYTKNGDTKIDKIIPDILVTKGKEVIAYVELKYVPHGYIKASGDIWKFNEFYNHIDKAEIKLETESNSGDWVNDYYKISNDLILVYGFVSNQESEVFVSRNNVFGLTEYKLSDDALSKINYVVLYGGVGSNTTKFGYTGRIKDNIFSKEYNLL